MLERGVVTSLVWEGGTDDQKDTKSPQEEVCGWACLITPPISLFPLMCVYVLVGIVS